MNIISQTINTIIFHFGGLLGRIFRHSYFVKAKNGKTVSESTLLKIVRENRNTAYGKKYNFSQIKSVEDYRNNVPLSLYEDYMDYVERSKNGENNLLTRKKIKNYANTSGTTGIKKYIPQSSSTLVSYFKVFAIFVDQCIEAIRRRNVSTFNIKGFCNTEVSENRNSESDEYSAGVVSSYAAGAVKWLLPIFTQLPSDVIGCGEIDDKEYVKSRYALQERGIKFIVGVFMSSISFSINYIEKNMEMLIEDIEKGTIDPSIKMSESIRNKLVAKLRPDPERAAELRHIMNTPSDIPFASRIWPELSFIAAIGTGDFEPFTRSVLSKCLDDITICHSVYAASEALIAFAFKPNEASYLPLVDSAFYEFIPVDDEGSDRRTLLMSELEIGKLYEIVVTTKAGLYRYQLRDVVRVVGYEGETPLIQFAYRANLVTNICGTHITNDDLMRSVKDMEKDFKLNLIDYTLYPNMTADNPHVKLFIEFDNDLDDDTISRMKDSVNDYIRRYNTAYIQAQDVGQLKKAELHLLKKNTFYNLRKEQIAKGASANQLKVKRIIEDEKSLAYFRSCSL